MSVRLVINLLLVAITMIVMIAYLIKLNKEIELKKIAPIKFKIIKYYGKDKKTEVKDITEAFYVDVKNGFTSINKLKLRERLSYNQDELLVHCGGGDYLAYKEYRSYVSEEDNIAIFHNFKMCSIYTVMTVIFLVGYCLISIWCSSDYVLNGYDYELGVINENIDIQFEENIKSINRNNAHGVLKVAIASMANETLGIHQFSEPDSIQEYQYNFIVADAREAFVKGERTTRELVKTGLPLRDYVYTQVREYMIEQGLILYDAFNGNIQEERIDVLKYKYTGPLYMAFMYNALTYAMMIFSIMHILYKIIMNVIFIKLVRKYQERLGV